MVLRDYSDPRSDRGVAYVLCPSRSGYRYPSTITLHNGCIYFGDEAEARRGIGHTWDSLKAGAAIEQRWEGAVQGLPNFTIEDLVALSIAHYVSLGWAIASRLADEHNAEARLGITVSVPVRELQIPRTQKAYLRVSEMGYQLAVRERFDPQGKDVSTLTERLKGARKASTGVGDLEYDRWLRAEVAAAMIWPFMSPRFGEGPYTVIDIGAATTNASFFRIHSGHDETGSFQNKSGMAFFGASVAAPGMDVLDAVLARQLGEREPVKIRGREAEVIMKLRDRTAADMVIGKYYDIWADARRRAWHFSNQLQHWEGIGVLVIGGGSKVKYVHDKFQVLPGYFRNNVKKFELLDSPGYPNDLYGPPLASKKAIRFTGDSTFLLVAYGLSFHTGDMPSLSMPHEQSPFRREEYRRDFKNSEDLGYSGR